jgi:two-component system chemotaxis sensor kinase CheA
MSIRTKLFLGFGVLALCLILVTLLSLFTTSKLKQSVDAIFDAEYPKMQTAWSIQNNVNEISKRLRNYILVESEAAKEGELVRMNSAIKAGGEGFVALEAMTTDAQGKLIMNELRRVGREYLDFQNEVLEMAKSGNTEGAAKVLMDDGARHQQALFNTIEDLLELNRVAMDSASQSAVELYNKMFGILVVLPFMIILLGVGIVIWVSRTIVTNLGNVSSVMEQFAIGSADSILRLPNTSRDEIGLVAKSFNRMADSLKEQYEQDKRWREHNEDQAWLHSNLSALHGVMQSATAVEELCDKLLQEIAPLLGVCCGVIYVSEEAENQTDRYKLSGTYAVPLEDKEKLKVILEPGDGVLGQVIISRERVKITDLALAQIRITTGFTELDAAYIYINPFLNREKVEAVLELVIHRELSPIQEKFLEQLGLVTGLLLEKLKSQSRIEQLLRDSQALTEELQQYSEELNVQQEELMQTNSELEEQTAALQESENRLQIQQVQLEEINTELEEKAHELERQAAQLITASAYKSEFLANMSHELRTPLNSMLILAKLLAENREGNLTDKQVEFAHTVFSSGNDLLTLINQILDLARVESGKVQVNLNNIRVQSLVDFVKRNFGPVAQQKGLDLVLDIQPGVPDSFRSDPLRLQQILRNLLSNAIKFTDRGKVAFTVDVAADAEGSSILGLSVIDTGIGIPKDMQEVIFDAFVQGDGTTNRKYGGTGLGLSISRELARLLGGEIKLSSSHGEGCTFTLNLPLLEAEEEHSPAEELLMAPLTTNKTDNIRMQIPVIEDYSFSGKTVLIVDDDIRNVFALSSRLEVYGIKVLYADNGKGGIELLKQNPEIDLILMDVMMPVMDGYAATRQIRAIPQFSKLPIIFVTANAMKEDRDKSLEAGASDYIVKPVVIEQLLALLKIWLGRKS